MIAVLAASRASLSCGGGFRGRLVAIGRRSLFLGFGRGKRNEPALVVEVAKTLASVRDLRIEEVASRTAANFRAFFHLGVPVAPGRTG